MKNMPKWLDTAVFYEIYPQSFYDSNGDGIGDIPGIIEKLPYLSDLGINALWINPCFDSPFKDAGYDVRDYKRIAPRYGTNEDAARLFSAAHEAGIRVLLDLVPGHTSEEHPWFLRSKEAEENEYSDRYIWTDFWITGVPGRPYIGGEAPRNGTYMLNFFKCQPALNYGWKNPTESWQSPSGGEAARKTIEAIKDVMRFWLDMGCDGFRVDMADSLVKNDDERKSETSKIWREIRDMLDQEYPETAMVSEWSNPELAINSAGFHMDFYLDHIGNGYNTLLRDGESGGEDNSYFRQEGKGSIRRFLTDYLPRYTVSREKGYMALITCNHDTPRASLTLSENERKIAYATIFTLPGVPFLYYGDEIGMSYRKLPTKEGGYTRTGSRTPMQWNNGANLGFSTAEPMELYLPVEERGSSHTVEAQQKTKDSLYHVMRQVIQLRKSQPDLCDNMKFEVLADADDTPFIYKRGKLICMVNPGNKPRKIPQEVNDSLKFVKNIFQVNTVSETVFTEHQELAPGCFVCMMTM